MNEPGHVLFGYRHVAGIPYCPCGDPGNYLMAMQGDSALEIRLRCWCGSSLAITFDDEAERETFLEQHRDPT